MTATVKKPRKVSFQLEAPEAASVLLVGDFTGWKDQPVPLKRAKNGPWKGSVNLAPGRYEYRFVVDGEWRNDPACEERVANVFGTENCLLSVS